jgi:hypothetical protein
MCAHLPASSLVHSFSRGILGMLDMDELDNANELSGSSGESVMSRSGAGDKRTAIHGLAGSSLSTSTGGKTG